VGTTFRVHFPTADSDGSGDVRRTHADDRATRRVIAPVATR
jgi:hypothetical protein